MKALALFSGGLDSTLAIKLVQKQGIEVIALNFVSHFFGGKNEKADNMAKQLGVKLEYVDFSKIHTELVKNPPSGRGKNMNPCIDCHALMFEKAGELLEQYGASFLISGEVLGQRPMSQNFSSLNRVKKLSGVDLEDLIVRPLCAKLLPITKPEELGWIDREQLMDVNGRSRKVQLELVEKWGIVEYPTPGGGCMLTEPNYSKRLRTLEEDGFLSDEYSHLFHLTKRGRFFRLDSGKYLFVGREKDDNFKLSEYKGYGTLYIAGAGTPGPAIVGYGDLNEDQIALAQNLFSRYSQAKGKKKIQVVMNEKIVDVEEVNLEKLAEDIKKYLVL
ncbi:MULTISPECIES: 7-cyano-7-deazaguanine synthase [Psychrilyobacter]|uniref:tRNA (5-methylaminomethyl-2-thiouridylate)-methyltransferase n=1 Tax=Psychrilyobacter piezotolerans TaxID=2293438 RepID=A0ABX9KLG5_9FUSO|nr:MULTISPECIES: 7-cyano-7-deazaguanine synthase [Psychrilyobacter]MCS5420386.1 7-cyano-7-deazaguanine synthase [Psychrilyobacter sp. S5]NDI76396.1 tRNA (5-methylaminomethyl-2-thiouridylate)-methyltransferase [Psychrilyobacter piezotolerans]RDE65992.1 tRNA (5-methylaminomethyl-2-thiouridylate)-methyltransferase [Psychrilyobacter sp. S5]REI43170.1 tRNA (5-methylaminomethyl-2-thiouridylate)-methyltransferase [Psychrilyobacter piezotolerans]